MNLFFKAIQQINSIDGAINKLKEQIEISTKLQEIIDFIMEAH